jgi:aminoglycoside phosphotransferase (APT) family kinase protein
VNRPLPAGAVAWIEEEVGGRVVVAEPVTGATTVEIHRVGVARGAGSRTLVIRRYAVPGYLAEWPGRPAHEATVLEGLGTVQIPAPRLVAVDAAGERCDVPAVLMTAAGGIVDHRRAASPAGCRALAGVAALLHAGGPVVAPVYRPYRAGHRTVIPPWAADPGPWRSADRVALPDDPAGFLHRDFHPGNVLWTEEGIGGLVDWGEACMGPAGVDVAHCRVNLALSSGPGVADRFSSAYESATGAAFDRRWDVNAALDLLPHDAGEGAVAAWPDRTFPPGSRRRLEAFLAAALRTT